MREGTEGWRGFPCKKREDARPHVCKSERVTKLRIYLYTNVCLVLPLLEHQSRNSPVGTTSVKYIQTKSSVIGI